MRRTRRNRDSRRSYKNPPAAPRGAHEGRGAFPPPPDAQLQQAIETALNAFLSWRDTPSSQRAAVLTKAAQLLRASKLDFAKILTLEMGKLLAEA